VRQEVLSDAALVLLGHGSTVNAESAATVYQHATELRRRKIFAEVREAFWKQAPLVKEVLSSIATPRVFLAPLFMSEGYFSEQVIPRELGLGGNDETRTARMQRKPGRTLLYCKPIGTHDRMKEIVLARAREVSEKSPFPRAPEAKQTSLFIAGHGT